MHKEPVLKETDNPHRRTMLQSETMPGLRRPERLVQLDPLDHKRYQQLQNIPSSQLLPHYRVSKLTDHATGAVIGGQNERVTEIGQVSTSTDWIAS